MGALFANVEANNKVIEVIAPEDNRRGLIIRTCALVAANSGVCLQLFADTSAPSAYGDGSRRLIFIVAVPAAPLTMPYALHIPAGNGIWLATNGYGTMAMSYDLVEPEIEC